MNNKKKILIFLIIIVAIIFGARKLFNKEDNYEQITFNEIVQSSENLKNDNNKDIESKIKVHIVGEVNNPGLIEIESGSRLSDVIECANGLTSEANVSKINLAYIVSDGEKLYIPSLNDEENNENIEYMNFQEANSKININIASVTELQTISGIGVATANAIIDYRNQNGKFLDIEDVKNVSGIGESKFNKMKDYITVK